MSQLKNNKNLIVLQIIPQLKLGGVERGVIDTLRFLNNRKIENYIFCEQFNPNIINFKEKKQIFRSKNLKFKNFFKFFKLNNELRIIINKKKNKLNSYIIKSPSIYFL